MKNHGVNTIPVCPSQRIVGVLYGAGVLLLLVVLAACTGTAPAPVIVEPVAPQVCPEPEPQACVPVVNVAEQAALQKLALANEWHDTKRYVSAFEAYEAVLAENVSPMVDAYALFGLVAMRLDRNSSTYDRESAGLTMHVLRQRAAGAKGTEASELAQLLMFSARAMVAADIDKDNVIVENRALRSELEQREDALKRLREVTLGR